MYKHIHTYNKDWFQETKTCGPHGWPGLGFQIQLVSPKCHGPDTLKADSLEDGSKVDSEQPSSPNQMIDRYQDPPKRRCYRTEMARPGTVLDNMAPNVVLWALALTMQA